MGGSTTGDTPVKTVLYAPITSLIHKAMSPPQHSAGHSLFSKVLSLVEKAMSPPQQSASRSRPESSTSSWKTFPDTPLFTSAAATLNGSLLAVGGYDDQQQRSPAVHMFNPFTKSWVRVKGDLPLPCTHSTAIQLPSNKLLIVTKSNTAFLGELAFQLFMR